MSPAIRSKSALAVVLSRLEVFYRPKVSAEQYPTDSEIAAEVLWSAFMRGDIENKVIADLGCGTGILGLGALLLGAGKVLFIDIDENALEIVENNIAFMKSEGYLDKSIAENRDYAIICKDISEDDALIDEDNRKESKSEQDFINTVIQNPPFGTRKEHIDRIFLSKALMSAPVVYSFHKTSTDKFIKAFCRDEKVSISDVMRFHFPLKNTYEHHRKRIKRIEVSCYRLEKPKK